MIDRAIIDRPRTDDEAGGRRKETSPFWLFLVVDRCVATGRKNIIQHKNKYHKILNITKPHLYEV